MVFLVNKKLICIAFLALSSVDVTSAQDSATPTNDSGVGTPTEDPTTTPTALEAPRGGNVDENGCNPSAGYSWCPSLDECIRSFETDCPSAAPTDAPILPGSDVDENGCKPSAGYSWCPSLEECIRSFETDCPSAAPTDSPILPGSDRDENGCIPSAGYSWCAPLEECIKSWETDCPGTTTPSPTKSPTKDPTPSPTKSPVKGPTPSPTDAPVNRPAPGSDRDENGCIPSAGYSWCESLEECIKLWETDCPGTTPSPTAKPTSKPLAPSAKPTSKPTLGGIPAPPVVAECSAYESCRKSELEGNCCPTDEGDMLGCCSGIDPETPVVAPTPPPAPPTTTEFPFTALPTAGGSSSVSSIMTVSTIAVAVAVAALL